MNGKQKIIIGKSFWWWSWAIFSKAILTRGMFWLGWANSKQIQNKSKDYLSWKTCFNIKITKIAWFICSRRKLQHIVMPDIKTRHITTNIKTGGKSRVKQVKKKKDWAKPGSRQVLLWWVLWPIFQTWLAWVVPAGRLFANSAQASAYAQKWHEARHNGVQ